MERVKAFVVKFRVILVGILGVVLLGFSWVFERLFDLIGQVLSTCWFCG